MTSRPRCRAQASGLRWVLPASPAHAGRAARVPSGSGMRSRGGAGVSGGAASLARQVLREAVPVLWRPLLAARARPQSRPGRRRRRGGARPTPPFPVPSPKSRLQSQPGGICRGSLTAPSPPKHPLTTPLHPQRLHPRGFSIGSTRKKQTLSFLLPRVWHSGGLPPVSPKSVCV